MLLGDCPVDLVKNTIKAVGTNEEAAFLCAGTENEEKAQRITKEMKRNTVTFEREANAPPPVKKGKETLSNSPQNASLVPHMSPPGGTVAVQRSRRARRLVRCTPSARSILVRWASPSPGQ
jgi:hypothetical protein